MTTAAPEIIPQLQMPQPQTDNRVSLPVEWPYRLLGNALILGFILFLASIAITVKTDLINQKLLSLQDSYYMMTSKLGFTVDDIIVDGRRHTSKAELLKAMGIDRGTNILRLDLYDLKDKIESLPWVRSAVVRRSYYPNVIRISLREHQVKSLWQINETFHPIDEDGKVIDAPYIPDKPLLLIVGAGAPENINQLLSEIDTDSPVFKRVKVASFISGRRWNLILDDIEHGITIKLPEQNVAAAWKKLLKLNATKNILKRKLTNIDLRLKGKVIITLEKSGKKAPKKLKSSKESKI